MSTPDDTPTPRSEAPAARVRHLHAACQLLSLERGAAVEPAPAPAGPTTPTRAPGLVRAAVAALVVFGATAALAVALWPGGRVERVADHRLGARAADAELADALFDPATGRVVVATRGGGLHTLDPDTNYWRRVGRDTTGGLPSDDIVRLARGDDGMVYVLYESDGARGLCRANPAFTEWQNLVGPARFPELTEPNPARVTSVATVEGRLWVATDRAGVGVYDPKGRGWVARHRAGDGSLPDDHVHDLLVAPDGALWAATGGGIARYRGEAWERFGVPELAGKDVRRLRWREGMLWYATAGGGMGRFGGEKWETLAAESGWGESGDADVLRACLDAGRERVWLAGAKTLGGYDLRTRSWAAPVAAPGAVTAMAAGGAGGPPLWAATGDGLFALKADAKAWDGPAFPKQKVVAIDAAGATALVAVETTGGLNAAFAGGGTAWRKLTGGGHADVGSRGVLAACVGPDGKVIVGTERGVSVYDPAVRDWVGDHAPGADKDNPLAVIDLVPDADRVIALTGDAAVRAWDAKADSWSVLAGGGRFPGALADVTAVTRDATGRLWLAARGKGLHRYDPAARRWEDAGEKLKDVAALAASADGVWALVGGRVHLIAEGRETAEVKLPPLVQPARLFAAPASPGAVVLDAAGRVALLNPAGGTVVVGDAAPGLDPAKVTAAGVLGGTAVLGAAKGPTFRYDAAARSWSKVLVDDVTQVVPALGTLWLLGPQSKVYALEETPTDRTPRGVTVSSLAGAADQLVALAADGSAWSLAAVGANWREVRAAPAGPAPGLLADAKLAVAAAGDDLYLADAAKLWHFNWPGQRWQSLVTSDGRPLGGGPLVHAHGRLFTLVGGKVYSAAPGEAKAREEAVAATQLRLAGARVAAVVPRESVSLLQNGKWASVFGATGRGLLVGDAPVDAAEVPNEGVFVLGSKGAAVVSKSLSGWAPVAGTAAVERVEAGRDGVVWGVNRAGQLHVSRKGNDGWRWAPVAFPKDATVAALAVGGGAKGDAHWATLADGAVYRLTAGADPKAWRLPSKAPGRPADLVAAAPTADGFLVAFRGGELAHYRTGPRTWNAVEAPKTDGVAQLLVVRTPAAASYWLLAKDGSLFKNTAEPGAGGWKWEPAGEPPGSKVIDVAVAGDTLLVVSTAGGMSRFDAAGTLKGRAGGAVPREVKRVADAGEIALPGGGAVLVLADGDGLVAYHPTDRRWAAHPLKAVELHPASESLVGRTEADELKRIEWADRALKVTDIDLGAPVRRVATGADGRLIAALADGRVVIGDGRAARQVLVGAALPDAARVGPVRDVTAVGGSLLLATGDGVYSHDDARGWEKVAGAGKVTKLAAGGGAAFAQAEEPAGTLLRLTEKDGAWSVKGVVSGLRAWHAVANGVVAERDAKGVAQTVFVGASGEAEVVFAPGAGPPEADVVGAAAGEVGVTSDGKQVYVATAAGLVVREAGGKRRVVHEVEGGATGLRWSADGATPRLLVRGGDKVFALVANGLAEKTAADWDAAAVRPLVWNGARVTPKVSADRTAVELQADAKRPPVVLDLKAGGFRHDRADAVALGGAAWVAYPGHVRRIALAPNGARESFPLGAAEQAPALRRVEGRVFAVAGADAYLLDDRNPPEAKPTPNAVPTGFAGKHWRVGGGKVEVKVGAAWNATGFDPKRGFVADSPRRMAGAGKTLVVAPEGGPAFRADLPATGLPALADFVQVAGTDGRPARVDDLRAAGDVVYAGGDGWFRLTGTPPRWQTVGQAEPPALADLGGSAAAQWRRVGEEVHLIEPGPGGAATVSILRTERFEFDHVRAAAETAAGVWLATDAGLWLADTQGGAWKPVQTDARGDAAFRRRGADWFLRVQPKGAADRVFRLDGEAARPVADDAHPFREPEVLADVKDGLRVTRRDGKLAFEVPKAGGGSHPVAYLPDQGRFDFQVVTDVGGDGKHLLAATPAGVVAWDVDARPARLVGVRADLKELPAPAVQDQSDRWQCRRGATDPAPVIRRQLRAGGPWVELPLHADGGFEYQRAAKVIPGAAGGAWTASGRTLVRHTAGAGPWVPDALWRAAQIGADGDITDVFTTDAGVCVVIGGRVFTPNGTEWQPAANEADLLRRRAALAASADAVWEKTDGGLRLTRRLAGGESMEQTFDQKAQRFPADHAHDAAVWDGAVWLTTPAGVVRVVAETRQTAGLLKADGAAWTALQFDRDANKLLAVGGTGVVLAGRGDEPPSAAGPAAPEVLARLAGAAFADADWRFTLGPAPALTWRGLTSGVSNGRFAHDTFTRLFLAERALWTATPVGLIRHELQATGMTVAEVLPLPPDEPAVEVVSAGAAVRCAAAGGKAYDWDRAGKTWKGVPDADPGRERVLIDTPLWTWTRDAAGKPVVRVKPADAGPADAVVRADGRFAFDGAAASLADADGAWLAGFDGIVRVAPDGAVRLWFRSGVRGADAVPLGAVVRLGRFDTRGDPLPSSTPPERLAGAALFAADDKGGAWRYEPGSPGRWVSAAVNPWGAARGGWAVRTPVFGAWEDEQGAVKLRHVVSGADGPAGPVLRGGRFLADVTRSITFGPDAGFAATAAGVVEFDPKTGRPLRLWRGAAGGGDLSACAEVFAHSGDGRLYAAGPGAEVYGRDGAAWAPVRADDDFRATAEVLQRDGFWSWHRWAGRADARVTAGDPAPPGWSLFTDGRFSFDVLLDVRVGSDVRATTAGGVARFRAADLAPEWLDRTATEADGGRLVPLATAVRFADAGGDVCEGGGRRFTRGDGKWVAVRAPAEGERVTVATDGSRSWRVSPVVGDDRPGGFEVTLTEGGAVVWRGRALRGTPPDQLRAAVAAKGRLWIVLERGVYRVTP